VNEPFFGRRSSGARLDRRRSDVFEIRRPAAGVELPREPVLAMPYAASSVTCELLAAMALEHVMNDEPSLARRAAEDALLMIESLASSPRPSDRVTGAEAGLKAGEAFLLLHEAHRAKGCFDIAIRSFDAERDLPHAAQARVGLAKALLALRDPSARAVLEDAGEIFEDLGDEEAVFAIDFVLRQAQADFDESPRSFHARAS
jgi:hypothetical protein